MTGPTIDNNWIFEHIREYIESQLDKMQADIDRSAVSDQAQLDRRFSGLEKDFIARIAALEAVILATSHAQKEAVDKSQISIDKRLEAMNEFRLALIDQNTRFVQKEVIDPQLEDLRKQLQRNQERLNLGEGHDKGITDVRATVIAIITILVAAAAIISPHIH